MFLSKALASQSVGINVQKHFCIFLWRSKTILRPLEILQRVKRLTKMQVRMKRKDASCCICKLKCQEDSTLALALTYLILDRNLNFHPNEVLVMKGYGQLAGAALIQG